MVAWNAEIDSCLSTESTWPVKPRRTSWQSWGMCPWVVKWKLWCPAKRRSIRKVRWVLAYNFHFVTWGGKFELIAEIWYSPNFLKFLLKFRRKGEWDNLKDVLKEFCEKTREFRIYFENKEQFKRKFSAYFNDILRFWKNFRSLLEYARSSVINNYFKPFFVKKIR